MTSTDDLRNSAADWDDLWSRSNVTTPTARADLVAQWLEQFAPHKDFHAIVVEHDGRWAAALPLLRTRIRRFLTAGGMCGSTWIPGGALLLDETGPGDKVTDLLVQGIRELPWQLLWLKEVRLHARYWGVFQEAVGRAGMALDVDEESSTGFLDTKRDWEAYKATWSKKHRNKLSNCERRLATTGEARFVTETPVEPGEVAASMHRAFEIENQSWKGKAGSSVVERGEFEYLLHQAQQLAKWKQLELHFLECNGSLIAFAYVYYSKGVRHLCKIGYDPEYASVSPGQLLFSRVLEHAHRDRECQGVDFFGRLTEAISRWKPESHPIGRIVVAPRRLLGRLALYTYRQLRRREMPGNGSRKTTMAEDEVG